VHKAGNLTTSCAVVMKNGNLNFLEPSGPLLASNGTALSLPALILFLHLCYGAQNIYFLNVAPNETVHADGLALFCPRTEPCRRVLGDLFGNVNVPISNLTLENRLNYCPTRCDFILFIMLL